MSLFVQLYKSLYSPKDIARFRFQKIGKTILYIFLLSLLSIIPQTIHLGNMVQEAVVIVTENFESNIPEFTIENGELQADVQQPIVAEEQDFVFLMDPNVTSVPAAYANKDGLFFLKNDFVVSDGYQTESYSYSMLETAVITKEDVSMLLDTLGSILPIVLIVIGLFFFLFNSFMRFIGITALAFIGTSIGKQTKRKLNYKQSWTLASYSTTLPTIFFMIMNYLYTDVPYSFLIFSFVSIVMLYIAIKEMPLPKDHKE